MSLALAAFGTILEYEGKTTSDVDHDMEMEARYRTGEIELPAA